MKKYFLLIILVLGGLYANSQGLDDVKKMIILQQYDKAKPEIDKYMADPKNSAKPEGWYYKAFTYNSLARVATKQVPESKTLNQESYVSVKKYMELDPKAPLTKEENNSTIYNVYYSFYDLGVKMYNEKNYQESYDLFKSTLDVHDYIFANNLGGPNGLKFSAHDTDIVWNLVVLANELKKKEEVMGYYIRIADANLSDEKYAEAYDELIKKYKKEDNKELFEKYMASAKKYYPVDKIYWESTEIEFAIKGLENEALFKKYEELTISHPNTYMVFFNYGYELTKYVYSDEAKGKDVSAYKQKIPELFKKANSIKSTIDVNVLLANFYYNSSFDYIDEANKIKGTKPEDVKKRNEQLALGKSTINQAIPYGEEAVKLFAALKEYKMSEKANYKQVLDILSVAYKQNGNAAKAAEYEKRKAEVDKL
jgi:hypothetical protein